MNASVHAKLLSNVYFGSMKPIESGVFAETLQMPSIYTFAGALMTRLLELGMDNPRDNVKKGDINIYGIYIRYDDKYYVPITPYVIDRNLKLRLPINKDNFISIDLYSSTSILHNNVLIPRFEGLDKDNLKKRYFIEINNIKEDAPVKSDIIKYDIEERIRTALKYDTKTPDEEKLFSLSMLSHTKDHFHTIYYCLDVKLQDEYKLNKWVGHFGGENSIAEFSTGDNTPLMDIINKYTSDTYTYLAVSHIPIKYKDGSLITKYGKIRNIIGKITQLGGYDIYESVMKKIYACIEPGSIFILDNKTENYFGDEWYIELLNSVIPIM